MNRPLPTVVFLVGGKIAVASVRDQPYMITFAHRQAFFATANRPLTTVISLTGGNPPRLTRLLSRIGKPFPNYEPPFADCRISCWRQDCRCGIRRPGIYDYFCTQTSLFRNREPPFTDCRTSYRRQNCRCISPPTCHIRLLLRTDKPFSQP